MSFIIIHIIQELYYYNSYYSGAVFVGFKNYAAPHHSGFFCSDSSIRSIITNTESWSCWSESLHFL